jgi:lysophospholipase L1-like esterase
MSGVNMKSVYYLVLLAIFLVNTSAPPTQAAIQTDLIQPSRVRFPHTYIPNPANTRLLTYLPLSLSNFRSTCQGAPERILALFGSSLIAYYPLWETGGNTVVDLSPYNRDGVYKGDPTLNLVPALCGSAPRFDGVDDIADVFSTELASAFNGDEGTAIIQVKIDREEWVDGKVAYYLALRADSNNNIVLYKTANNQLEFAYTAGGVWLAATFNDIDTDHWVTYAITWSKSKDRFQGYVAGASICPEPIEPISEPICPPQSGLGAWAGELTSAEIAGYLGSGSSFAKTSMSSLVLLDREATAAEIREYSASFGATKVLSILGDSITRVFYSSPWSIQTVFEYEGGNKITLMSHAVSAKGIMTGMDAQTEAAASDDADIIIIALGAVDDNAGDMVALQAEAEENIAELMLSNPGAAIYFMNVLPLWTDSSGETEQDKSKIRAAIDAACDAQNITCWDTYSSPWITVEDTTDGVHPNAVGHTKIANQVLLRIQSSIKDGTTKVP